MCKTPRSSLVGKLPPSACISSILARRIAWRTFLQCALGKQHSPARFRLLSMDKGGAKLHMQVRWMGQQSLTM